MKKILLIGNPNVGKSLIFNRLTGVDVIVSNYPGTTVEFTKGRTQINNQTFEIIDVPGIYSLEPTSKAEEVAVKIFNETFNLKDKKDFNAIVINILDTTNIERNLYLTLQLIEKKVPMILVLNFCDEIKHKGIEINFKELENILEIPVVSTCARSGEGINELTKIIFKAKISNFKSNQNLRWEKIGEIVSKIQKISHKHHSLSDIISEITISPATGLPLAVFSLFLTFFTTRFIGENLITYVLDPIFNNVYLPFIKELLYKITSSKIIHTIFLGTTETPMESFGILVTGIYIPLVAVFPYIFSFYLILSILEDIGYLPRVAVMLDNFLHKLGVHGYSSVPILLGLGCKVPGILATRILETKREKILATILVLTISPCMPQTAMIISLVAPYGTIYVILIFLIILFNSFFITFLLNKFFLKGEVQELFLEIPPYRNVHLPSLAKKLFIRTKQFFYDAVPLIIIGVAVINIFELSKITTFLAETLGKFLLPILGLPKEISSIIILGFLKKDVSIALLTPFNLPIRQLIIASIFMVLYLPCASTSFVIFKEYGTKTTFRIISLMLFSGIFLTFFLNLFLRIFLK